MSIDNLQLPGFLYQSMFKKNLVDLKAVYGFPKNTEIDFLGGNEKNIIFLVNDNQNKFLGDKELNFLSGLLTACKLTMVDIALVNFFQNNTITYHELINKLSPKKILIFGIPSTNLDLPFTIPFFQIQNFHEQVYMLSPSLNEIQTNKEFKKQIWQSLQKIFKIPNQK